jgi:tetratricopeptide (TPR) repeat protein
LGEFGAARALIDRTPGDCYLCVRMRGNIDAAQGKWDAAGWWFDIATRQAPSIPFAYSEWGAMLLREARYDDAIAKFSLANEKGPHFADPLEMWGEALIAKNRSHLALAKFAEANKYAPNWGRLHLKWGEALFFAGRPEESKRQFAIAARLDLSPVDKASLAAWMKAHG